MTLTLPSAPTHAGRRLASSLPRLSIDHILEHARHLAAGDRALIEGVYLRGMSAAELARAAGKEPGTVRKRLARVVRRMSSPIFRFVVRHKSQWPPERAAIADAVILRGLSQRTAAMTLGLGVHRVRRELDGIRALLEAAGESRPSRSLS